MLVSLNRLSFRVREPLRLLNGLSKSFISNQNLLHPSTPGTFSHNDKVEKLRSTGSVLTHNCRCQCFPQTSRLVQASKLTDRRNGIVCEDRQDESFPHEEEGEGAN